MSAIDLRVDQLLLDTDNPRIGDAASQRDALQKVLDDQGDKLAALANSIATDGMNPMDRVLVVPEGTKYIVLEGNRRAAALKILANPNVLTSLELTAALQKRLEKIATRFQISAVEPLAGYVVKNRDEARPWLFLRHTGENQGKGVVSWSGLQTQRFRGDVPSLQALELVREYGSLSDTQKASLDATFPITTLDRLLSSRDVRARIGIDVKRGRLVSALPASEVIKPLRRMVIDLAEGRINVSKLKNKTEQAAYIDTFGADSTPHLEKATGTMRELEALRPEDFERKYDRPKQLRRKPSPSDRNVLIPRRNALNITDHKVAAIADELRGIRVSDYPNAVAVLFRVFLELSVDHYMDKHNVPTFVVDPKNGRQNDKTLSGKVRDVIEHLVSQGSNRKDFQGVSRALSVAHSPLSIDLLNAYIHNRFVQPKTRDLVSTWDDARRFFESIWP